MAENPSRTTEQQAKATRQRSNGNADAAVQQRSCGHCGHENPADSRFCAGCGQSVASRPSCSGCGRAALPGGDICEACGTWLLVGHCCFCGRAIDATETFCGQCGNPSAGISCMRCGKVSIFDYCKTCLIPLSHQAVESTSAAASDPALAPLVSLLEELATTGAEEQVRSNQQIGGGRPSTTHDDQIARMQAVRQAAASHGAARPAQRPTLFSADQRGHIEKLAVAVGEERARLEREEERRRLEAEQRRLAEVERQRKLEARINEEMAKLSRTSFSSQQEARRYFMGLLASLPEEIVQRLASRGLMWRCHAYNCTHTSPADCADPSQGGVWLLL